VDFVLHVARKNPLKWLLATKGTEVTKFRKEGDIEGQICSLQEVVLVRTF
jgi:hypothetical protein